MGFFPLCVIFFSLVISRDLSDFNRNYINYQSLIVDMATIEEQIEDLSVEIINELIREEDDEAKGPSDAGKPASPPRAQPSQNDSIVTAGSKQLAEADSDDEEDDDVISLYFK